jgi:transcriptional regulator with XRE-family HTH domain
MPKKHEKEDRKFIKDFAHQLESHYKNAKLSGISDEAFAESLDVSRQALQDYLDAKAMPTIRTLALAVDRYGVDLGYKGTEFRASRRGQLATRAEEQLTLPFVFVSPDPRVALKLGPVTENTVTFGLQIKRAG